MSTSTLHYRLTEVLKPFVPEGTVALIVEILISKKIILTITEKRSSVYGDYRHPDEKKGHRISVNGDLNPYAFFITLMHEIAHMNVWEQHRNKVAPHGIEWKNNFKEIMQPFLNNSIFPMDVEHALKNYLRNVAATSCSDIHLTKALAAYDKHSGTIVQDLQPGDLFEFDSKGIFQRGEELRKRIRCVEMKTNRIYLFNPAAVVKKIRRD